MANVVTPAANKGPFRLAENQQAYMKAGILGFPGSGKTFTAALIARGIHERRGKKSPVFINDTESGSDYLVPFFREFGIPFYAAKTRAFTDLMDGVRTAEREGGILIIDSITHFWQDVVKSYQLKHNKSSLSFRDWSPIKDTWAQFSGLFLNSRCDIIMCGRAGYTYDMQDNDETGKKELIKTGTKMKVEADMGYEPSLLLEMELERKAPEDVKKSGKVWDHVATVLKDRTRTLEGKILRNPTFEDMRPAFEYLNIGGQHAGVDLEKNSAEVFKKPDHEFNIVERRKQVEIAKEEIEGVLTSAYPGASAEAKKAKTDLIFAAFGTRSWTQLDEMAPEALRDGRKKIEAEIAKLQGGK